MNSYQQITCSALLIFISFGTSAKAQTLRGIGFAQCSDYISWRANGLNTNEVVSWIYGFWSAENRTRYQASQPMKNILHPSVSPESFEAQLLANCREKPTATIVSIGDDIFQRLPDWTE